MKDLRKNDGKTMTEYQVMIMAMSGPNDWQWPELEDKIWFMVEQVKLRISPLSTTNSCDVCTTPAIFKCRCHMQKNTI